MQSVCSVFWALWPSKWISPWKNATLILKHKAYFWCIWPLWWDEKMQRRYRQAYSFSNLIMHPHTSPPFLRYSKKAPLRTIVLKCRLWRFISRHWKNSWFVRSLFLRPCLTHYKYNACSLHYPISFKWLVLLHPFWWVGILFWVFKLAETFNTRFSWSGFSCWK